MTDDEVMQWLSEGERAAWIDWDCGSRRRDDDPRVARAQDDIKCVLRTLAETRKALADCEWADDRFGYPRCPLCAADGSKSGEDNEPHAPTCFFATIPRPR